MQIRILIFLCIVSLANIFLVEAAEMKTIKTNSDTTEIGVIYTNFLNSFVWGQPTNNLSLGIKFLNPTVCKAGQPDVLVYLLNVGPTNMGWNVWIGPPNFQRVEFQLFDSAKKDLPYSVVYHPVSKVYKTASEIPKNIHNVRIGQVAPRRDFPAPYDEIILTNVFRIGRGGDYVLVAKGRIMKINSDSSLRMVEFPPISLSIHLDDQVVSKKQAN